MSYVVWFDEFDPALASRLGGKSTVLGELTRAGLDVPPGFAVTTDAYRAARGADDLPDDVRDAVAGAYGELCRRCGAADVPVAVRSSAVGEDAPDASFAGEHDTFLWVRGADEVLAAMRRCWASLFSERATAYRERLTRVAGDAAMGVAVQQMVLAETAGVAFTLDPRNGDRSQVAVDASWGFGEAVAAGEVTPDSYLVDKVLLDVTRRVVSDKDREYRPAADGRGIAPGAVPAARRAVPCLSDEQLKDVARLALRAERHYGRPQDVEWALETRPAGGYRLYLLQSRPETVWSRRPARPVSADEPVGYASIASTLATGERTAGRGRLPGPFDVPTPPGAEGWEELYTNSSLFSEGRREYEQGMFWFHDGVHWPTPLPPWDATFFEYAMATLSQYNTRHYLVPATLGIDYRILHGYAYLAPVPLADESQAQARAAEFLQRAGFYFSNWDALYAAWLSKVRALVGEIGRISFEPLPEKEDIAVITEGHGTGSGLRLVQSYRRLLDLALQLWMHHFEFLNLGYAAYLDLFMFCKHVFPGIPEQSVARMVAGIEVDVFRPDDELRGLARLAVELDLDGVFAGSADPGLVEERLRSTPEGRRWLAGWDEAADPWFDFSSGSGFYHSDRIWSEHREIPFGFVRDYAERVRRGEDLARPLRRLHAERERITAEYAALLPTDADRAAFQEKLRLSRVVFPYVENHNFYVEHWAHAAVWRKMRDLGRMLVGAGFLAAEDDVFCLRRNEVTDVLWDLYSSWAVGAPAHGPTRWPAEVLRRKEILAALARRPAPPALGVPPERVTEPFTIMLWGVTEESIAQWLGTGEDAEPGVLTGMAASPGVEEGIARVIAGPAEIDQVREGEILVAPLTAPSWAPIFGKIRATVTDVGGIMSHAAIVCREYGLPAVTGTTSATRRIRTGQRIRVDGTAGTVTILEEPD
jgi:pyruvate,water dikinase